MTVGFRNAAGVDFDDLFDFYSTGTPVGAIGFRDAAGVDIGPRYAPISFGSKGPDVGYRVSSGVDVSNLWAAKGTASYSIPGFNGRTFGVFYTALTNQPQVGATTSFALLNNGQWQFSTTPASSIAPPTSGAWLTSGSVADYQALIEVVSSSGSSGYSASGNGGWLSLTANQGGSLQLPNVAANNSLVRNAAATFRVRIRRASDGVVVSDNTVNLTVGTQGYL